MTKYIALSGKKQTGKNTAAEIICRHIGGNVVAFADPLKRICMDVFGCTYNQLYGNETDKNSFTRIIWEDFPLEIRVRYSKVTRGPRSGPMTAREIVQIVGTDIFRKNFGEDVWARALFLRELGEIAIISDLRFPSEKSWTERHSGVIIRLERGGGTYDAHESETALDNDLFKYTYCNDGSINELEEYILNVLKTEQWITT